MSNASESVVEEKGSGGSFRASCYQSVHIVIKSSLLELFPKCLEEIGLLCEKISDENVFGTGTERHIVLELFVMV